MFYVLFMTLLPCAFLFGVAVGLLQACPHEQERRRFVARVQRESTYSD